MITDYAEIKLGQLEEQLTSFEEIGITAVKRLTGQLNCIASALNDLRSYIRINGFDNMAAEISFFKDWKPKFQAWRIYLVDKFTAEQHKPSGSNTEIRLYYEQELRLISRLFEKHQFIYQYYLMAGTDLDEAFFSRGGRPNIIFVPDLDDGDTEFSTPCDNIFAQFIAAEHLQSDFIKQLYPSTEIQSDLKSLKWTGDKINLLELAYAIYDTAQINHGEVDLVDILSWLEKSLDTSLHRSYRMFSEMKNRKSVSPTRYLDHAAAMVREHLRLGDEFRPQPPASVSGSKSAFKK
jgi:hypothetical protein